MRYVFTSFVILVFAVALFLRSLVVSSQPQSTSMNAIAERYVRLVLAMGTHEPDYVDAYYGPPEWRTAAEAEKLTLDAIDARAAGLLEELPGLRPPVGSEELVLLRHRYLTRQLDALRSRVAMRRGTRFTFDEESKALYDAVAPTHTEADFAPVLEALEKKLPGRGAPAARFDAFRSQFVIPRERLDAVFTAAIDECRSRTLKHIPMPAGESFTVEYVTNKSWSGYNWYQGGYRSLIQVNTDLPIHVDRAIDLACHEGYPGHHVYNSLLEKHLVRDRGWMEYSVYALFSPQSLIAEGTANYGIDVAFTREERIAFERDTLFPLAGLNPARTAEYYEVLELVERLSYAGNEAARRYLNGDIDAAQAADWLERFGLYARPRAEQRVRFMDQFRSYVINYNLGKDLVAAHVASRGGTADRPGQRWDEFAHLLSSPRLPSDLSR